MFGKRFTDREVRDCLLGNECMYMASEEYLDELRCHVDKMYPGLREEYRRSMYPPREKKKEKEPEKEQHRIYNLTDDELKKMLDTDEDPAEALRKYGLIPIYSMLKSMQWSMENMSRALAVIAEEMTKGEENDDGPERTRRAGDENEREYLEAILDVEGGDGEGE